MAHPASRIIQARPVEVKPVAQDIEKALCVGISFNKWVLQGLVMLFRKDWVAFVPVASAFCKQICIMLIYCSTFGALFCLVLPHKNEQ